MGANVMLPRVPVFAVLASLISGCVSETTEQDTDASPGPAITEIRGWLRSEQADGDDTCELEADFRFLDANGTSHKVGASGTATAAQATEPGDHMARPSTTWSTIGTYPVSIQADSGDWQTDPEGLWYPLLLPEVEIVPDYTYRVTLNLTIDGQDPLGSDILDWLHGLCDEPSGR